MKLIRFVSYYQDHVECEVNVGAAVCEVCGHRGGFHNGDEKLVTDDQAEILLKNSSFSVVQAAPIQPVPAEIHGEEEE